MPRGLTALWLGGFLLATLLMWPICAVFVSSTPRGWSDELGLPIQPEGSRLRWRSEGWATSRYGRYGIGAIGDVEKEDGGKLLLWGDSHIEGWQVPDRDKVAQQLTDLIREDGRRDLVAVGLGRSGQNIAAYYFQIPRYERLLRDVRHHLILFPGPESLRPVEDVRRDRYVLEPELRFLPAQRSRPSQGALRRSRIRDRFQLQFPSILLGFWREARQGDEPLLRIAPGPHAPPSRGNPGESPAPPEPPAPWDRLLAALGTRTELPVTFVYFPHVPKLSEGRVVYHDSNEEAIRGFAAACAREGMGFVSTADAFREHFRHTRRMPRGFANARRVEGHINRDGHRLLAEVIRDALGAGNAVLAD